LTPDEKLLYVALANADKVVAFDTGSGKIRRSAWTTPQERDRGTSPSALALSRDGARLFVADSSLNAVAVINAAHLAEEGPPEYPLGLIPTDWYPTAVAVHGDDLLIATGKGLGAGPNNGISALTSEQRRREHPYIPTLIRGSIARLSLKKLEAYLPQMTKQTEGQNLFDTDPGSFSFAGGVNPIKHVIYIIKENRTFDQVLGDLKAGNGDSSLTLYGQDITPNEHKLALQFGVLDNFYDSGEVSGDGHDWSTAAITTDYNEKTWQIAYRGKERDRLPVGQAGTPRSHIP
jgi:DNA-binding beta-propeller fold protein YncE